MAETNTLMPALLNDFRAHGGAVETRSFANKSDLEALSEPLIVNCTGIGAKALFGDPELTPLKGQITLIKPQPSPTPISIRCSISICFHAAMAWCSAAAMNSTTGQPMSVRAERRKFWKATL